jgi:hypothetical protein
MTYEKTRDIYSDKILQDGAKVSRSGHVPRVSDHRTTPERNLKTGMLRADDEFESWIALKVNG